MTEEMQKRIEEYISKLGMTHDRNTNPNVISPSSIKLGAKFILMLPELREIREVLEWYATKGEGPYTDAGIYRRAESVLEALKKAGLCE